MTYSAVAMALAGFLMAGPALAQVSLGGNIEVGATANAGGAGGLGLGLGAGLNLSDRSVEQTGGAMSAINQSDASYQAKISKAANADAALQQRIDVAAQASARAQ
ncbi:MAG: hypothetical protein B7Z78_03120 [Rhodospirillales bacterium 20-60-12]|nr:MAG: hypothetical protein B7Z78_03120 [Rhodospirillales bacterium 20-60-12]HQT67738.1 hypothetical protein [Acetobacteraceae bacterium]